MKTSISVKNIFVLLGAILGGLIVVWLLLWLVLALPIFMHDAKENKERGECFYNELSEKYEISGGYPFKMDYIYSMKKNIGFIGGGGYIGADCWERYIKDALSNQEVASVSLCVDEEMTKEKLDKLEEFWKKHEELFRK